MLFKTNRNIKKVALRLFFSIIIPNITVIDGLIKSTSERYEEKLKENDRFFSFLNPVYKYENDIDSLISEINALHAKYPGTSGFLLEEELDMEKPDEGEDYRRELRKKYMLLYSLALSRKSDFVRYLKKKAVPNTVFCNLLIYDFFNFENLSFEKKEFQALMAGGEKKFSTFKKLRYMFDKLKEGVFGPPLRSGLLGEVAKQDLLYCHYGNRMMLIGEDNVKDVYNTVKKSLGARKNVGIFFKAPNMSPEFNNIYDHFNYQNGISIFCPSGSDNRESVFDDNQLDRRGGHMFNIFSNFAKELKKDDKEACVQFTTSCKGNYNMREFFKRYNGDIELQKYFKEVDFVFEDFLIMQNNTEFMESIAKIVFNNENIYKTLFCTHDDFLHTFGSLEKGINAFFGKYIEILECETNKDKKLDAIIRLQDLPMFKLFVLEAEDKNRYVSLGQDLKEVEGVLSKCIEEKKRECKDDDEKNLLDTKHKIMKRYIDMAKGYKDTLDAFIKKHGLSDDIKKKREEIIKKEEEEKRKREEEKMAKIEEEKSDVKHIQNNSVDGNLSLENTRQEETTVSQQ